jgi:hypothetical protein
VVYDRSTGLTWVRSPNTTGMGWEAALAYCEGLNHAGRTDWRLPDLNELFSLFDFTDATPPLSAMPLTTTDGYWSSSNTNITSAPGFARLVTFTNPYDGNGYLTTSLLAVNLLSQAVTPVSVAAIDEEHAVRCVTGP